MGNKEIEFEAVFKKANLFGYTLHLIIYHKGSITQWGKVLDLKEDKKFQVSNWMIVSDVQITELQMIFSDI